MPYSMTGFVRHEQQFDWCKIIIEIRSVNSRYLDISMKLPDELRMMELKIKKQISARLARGKVAVNILLNYADSTNQAINYNKNYAKTIATTLHEIDKLIYNAAPVNAMDVLMWPGVMDSKTILSDQQQDDLSQSLEEAIDELQQTRLREGNALAALLMQRCDDINRIIVSIKPDMSEITQKFSEKLEKKLAEYKQKLDQERLEQEVVLLVQKMDIAEELDRIHTHIEEVKRILSVSDSETAAQGRRLDFLMQELNRESNTIGSKSVSVNTSQAVVELKVLIEQMREQVQNIE